MQHKNCIMHVDPTSLVVRLLLFSFTFQTFYAQHPSPASLMFCTFQPPLILFFDIQHSNVSEYGESRDINGYRPQSSSYSACLILLSTLYVLFPVWVFSLDSVGDRILQYNFSNPHTYEIIPSGPLIGCITSPTVQLYVQYVFRSCREKSITDDLQLLVQLFDRVLNLQSRS